MQINASAIYKIIFIFLILPLILHALPQKTIGIFTCHCGVKPWDADSIISGITGSEEAVIYLSQELAKFDYKVVIFADPPSNSPHTLPEANPRYVPLNADDGMKFDIAVAWRMPDAIDRLKSRAQHVYYWPHDTLWRAINLDQINGYANSFWLSKWQRKQHISISPAFAKFNQFFGNGIEPSQFEPVQERINPHACIYSSNYARGLEILLDIWPEIKKEFPKATLDIYYGWQHFGLLTREKEVKMRAQVEALATLDVVEHGLVGHVELNRAYNKASLWTYPCIAPETFCITALRAQLAGAVPVIVEGTALSETVRHGYKCQKAEEYKATLIKAMQEAENITLADRKKMGEFVLQEYTWKAIAEKWKKVFDSSDSR